MTFEVSSILDNLLEDVWFEITFLLVVSLFASFLFARFGQPRIIGYIVVGVVIGPSLLKIIVPPEGDVTGLPESIQILAQLGAIVLLFMIGLECDLREVYTRKSIVIALGGVIVPWIAGFALADAFGFTNDDAIFIGATLVATSVAVTASVTSQLGLIGTPVAHAIIGAAVVDDVLGMVVLSVSKGLTVGGIEPTGLMLLLLGALLFVLAGAWIGANFLSRLVFRVQVSGFRRKLPMSGFILALAIAFLYSFIAEAIGITAIVGAFVAGTAFSGSALRDGFRKGSQYLEAVFVPLFFVSLGVAVDAAGIAKYIWFGIVLTVVAAVTKVVGCGLPARAMGMSWWDSLAVGIGMTPRLEIALVIAYYGLSTEIISADIYSVVVFMGLATALFTPWLLRKSLERGGHSFAES